MPIPLADLPTYVLSLMAAVTAASTMTATAPTPGMSGAGMSPTAMCADANRASPSSTTRGAGASRAGRGSAAMCAAGASRAGRSPTAMCAAGTSQTSRAEAARGGGYTAPGAAMADGAAGMLPIAAAPSRVTVCDLAVAAAVDEDAAAHSPIHAIPAPKGWHDRPGRTPAPTDLDAERANSEIAG